MDAAQRECVDAPYADASTGSAALALGTPGATGRELMGAPAREAGRLVGIGLIGVLALAAATVLLVRRRTATSAEQRPPQQLQPATVLAARRLNRAAGVLAFSVLADSALEHYRGSFDNRAMFIPPLVSSLMLAISVHGTADQRPAIHRVRHLVYTLAAVTGVVGTGLHVYNIIKRLGGISWLNFFYGAPLGAPAAIALFGLLGYCSERVRETPSGSTPTLLDYPAGRALAAVTSGGLVATLGEVGLLHFRGAYHNPAMFLPVGVSPLASMLLANAALGPKGVNRFVTRWCLRLTAVLGFTGVGFHAYGVSRNMGGWRNWSQNVLNGPPLPAPPSFTGLALAGLAALGLMDDHPDA
jgi:hypothetical protein